MTRNILRLAALSSFAMSALALATLINIGSANAKPPTPLETKSELSKVEETIQDCHIDKAVKNGMLKLESLFGNDEAGSGTYKLSVRSLGGSNKVNSKSGGQFSKAEGEIVLLGKSFLTARGNAYEIKLDVKFNGTQYDCVEKIKTSI